MMTVPGIVVRQTQGRKTARYRSLSGRFVFVHMVVKTSGVRDPLPYFARLFQRLVTGRTKPLRLNDGFKEFLCHSLRQLIFNPFGQDCGLKMTDPLLFS